MWRTSRHKELLRIKLAVMLLALCGVVASLSYNVGEIGESVIDESRDLEMSVCLKREDCIYYEVNGNVPFFETEELNTVKSFVHYSELDSLGRTGTAIANLSIDLRPSDENPGPGDIKPSGWQSVRYPGIVDSTPPYLYNRCHLVGYQLSGETDNSLNLITGTRFMNAVGMLIFENRIADFLEQNPKMHVLYRVTPIYEGDNLLAEGVLMEAWSVEDGGAGIQFCVFVNNIQPGIVIDYANGESALDSNYSGQRPDIFPVIDTDSDSIMDTNTRYVVNIGSGVFHQLDCQLVSEMADYNRLETEITAKELISHGYVRCQICGE